MRLSSHPLVAALRLALENWRYRRAERRAGDEHFLLAMERWWR